MTATELVCASCGYALRENAKFCDECGARTQAAAPAEYKQVTVLFADVVHSMDIAAAVGPERLREIMAELVDRCAVVVQRYGGTVDKFTGDGIMAVFGAPVSLEDHAFRACLAAVDIQEEARRLASEVESTDHVELQLRVGLNSGQVIAGDIGSGAMGYTAIGEHVGMAQRMESVAAPGGVMLSESTARLVEHLVALSPFEMVQIKGSDAQVPARRLISLMMEPEQVQRSAPTFVGRTWEINSIAGILDEAVSGAGCVVNVVGPPGIGKSRLAQEASALAVERGMDVVTTFCESHAADIPFHAVTRLLRAGFGVIGLDSVSARARVRAQIPDTDPEDVALLEDLLGIADPGSASPNIEPDARRRRLTALINTATLTRATPVLYLIEDVHWIDEVSESMLAGFMTVVPQSRAAVLLTYRPEYRGALARVATAQAIALRPLSEVNTSALVYELLGAHPSVAGLAERIAQRAAGNPFFAEEMVRDLAERAVLEGKSGDYTLCDDVAEVSVPATLQATIASRIDRLAPAAKRTLSAAAVIGSRFGPELLIELGIEPALDELVAAELIDQVKFTRGGEFAFRHPLVRAVAYESQLKSTRAQLHRQLARRIETLHPEAVDEHAALIAEHLEAAGDLSDAFAWHMRAGTWLTNRDIRAARLSWERARQVADGLPVDYPDRLAMRIAPRTLLGVSSWRASGTIEDARFEELRELTGEAGDKVSLATAMAGQVSALLVHTRVREASRLATEYVSLLESIGDPTLTVALLYAAIATKNQTGEVTEMLRLAQMTIDLSRGDPNAGNLVIGSPLAAAFVLKGIGRACTGEPGWKDNVEHGVALAKPMDAVSRAGALLFKYSCLTSWALVADETALEETADMLMIAERSGDDWTLACARFIRGLVLVRQGGPERDEGFALLALAREASVQERFTMIAVTIIDIEIATERMRSGDLDGAVDLSRAVVEEHFAIGDKAFLATAVSVLVESLLRRGAAADVQEAQAAIERLEAVPTEPRYVLFELPLLRLRALLARARGEDSYGELVERYRDMATSLNFDGHIAMAKAMA
ncbi:MAG: adenylate/guanylate cyclase domain-containing protein [Candidatus Sericytochromatia bacterium]